MNEISSNLALRSTLRRNGDVEIALEQVRVPGREGGVVVEMLAAPIHPADMSLLFARADPGTAERIQRDGKTVTVLRAGDAAAKAQASRVDVPTAVGMEGAGRVVEAGPSDAAQALLGRLVAVRGNGVYARYNRIALEDILPLPDDVSASEGAAAFINPLTVLGMVELMQDGGFGGLVHTAAASTIGQMLCRLCREEGIGLVSIVRRPEQVELLQSIGAEHVCDMSGPGFEDELLRALVATGATLAFDATGGGDLASRILNLMERALPKPAGYQHYGSNIRKKVFIYGTLDPSPLVLLKNYGLAWDLGGYLVFHFLESIGPERVEGLKRRVVEGLKTTFAMQYSHKISLAEACDPDVLRGAGRRATGDKYLIDFSI
ncbi:NADH oxidase [Sphingomonas sp.]|uniref:NADH oxidase n=1 Tax=Sphingomonas sp. TaxID=28214 RepID=UPI0035BBC4A4